MVRQPNFPNAGGLKTLRPDDVLMDWNANVYVYLGYYSGTMPGNQYLHAGYLYVHIWIHSMSNYGWTKPGQVTDAKILYPDPDYPSPGQPLVPMLEPENFFDAACYVKNVKKFYELALHIDLTPIYDKIQRLGPLTRVGDRKPTRSKTSGDVHIKEEPKMSEKKIFTHDPAWTGIMDLKNALIEFGEGISKKDKTEIERKWLIKDGPELAKIIENDAANRDTSGLVYFIKKNILTAYVSVDPEIRIRENRDGYGNLLKYQIAYKGPAGADGLTRVELEYETTEELFNMLLNYVRCTVNPFKGSFPIQREVWIAEYADGHTYELKSCDHGTDWQMEVEFSSEEEAKAFEMKPEFTPYVGNDVTSDPYHKIKHYWQFTRLTQRDEHLPF